MPGDGCDHDDSNGVFPAYVGCIQPADRAVGLVQVLVIAMFAVIFLLIVAKDAGSVVAEDRKNELSGYSA